jgi:hypothetical protein
MPTIDGTCVAVGASPPPTAPSCGDGTLAIPGSSACGPIDRCSEDSFRVGPMTDYRYVDITADPALADGSRAHPFASIQRAIDAAPAGATISVTDGRYQENLVVTKPTRILGRCTSRVTIAGTKTYAIDVSSDLQLQNVSVTGDVVGIGVAKGIVQLVEVRVHDTGDRGIDVEDFSGPAVLTMRASLVERAHDIGIFASGATLTLDGSVVRGTRKPVGAMTAFGQGIQVRQGEKSLARGTLTMRKSVVEDNLIYGVLVVDSTATIEDSIVRRTKKTESSPAAGLTVQKEAGKSPSVTVKRSLFDAHEGVGIDVVDGTATFEDVTLRGVAGDAATALLIDRSEATIERMSVEDVVGNGITVRGSNVTMTSMLVRNITYTVIEQNGVGIVADSSPTGGRSDVHLADVLIDSAHAAGLMVFGSTVDAHDIAVRNTLASPSGALGDGVTVITRAYVGGRFDVGKLSLDRAILDGNARAGLVVFGATAKVSNTIMCNVINLDVERTIAENEGIAIEHDFVLEDSGSNTCGCVAATACAAQSTGLKPVAR